MKPASAGTALQASGLQLLQPLGTLWEVARNDVHKSCLLHSCLNTELLWMHHGAQVRMPANGLARCMQGPGNIHTTPV